MAGSPFNVPTLVPLHVIRDSRGALVVLESSEIGIALERMYFLFDMQAGAKRGGHAHKTLMQILLVPTGSFTVTTDDGAGSTQRFEMRSPPLALFLPPGTWRELKNFSSGAVCLVLASSKYEESDYIRDYSEFVEWKSNRDPLS